MVYRSLVGAEIGVCVGVGLGGVLKRGGEGGKEGFEGAIPHICQF